jgi:hypothetical protein
MNTVRFVLGVAAAALAALSVNGSALAMPVQPQGTTHSSQSARGISGLAGTSVTSQLHHITMIGSTVDPINGDQNPYGLAIAPTTSGSFTQGDLAICNFNDNLNIQGLGSTIEVLHPTPGSAPTRLVQDGRLEGCDAISLPPGDNPWVAAFIANDNPFYDPSGNLLGNLGGGQFAQPWGQTFSATKGPYGQAAFYESNAADGSIVRIGITKKGTYQSERIATGFSVNHGVPGTALAPSGLTYDPSNDTLYIVDGNVNELVAFHDVSLIPPHGIVVNGFSYSGVAGELAQTVFRGKPLEAPISAALLYNGNLVVGNTTNNVLVEIDPKTKSVVHMTNLDKGVAGALFGIAATGTSAAATQIFFNDDNVNAVMMLAR